MYKPYIIFWIFIKCLCFSLNLNCWASIFSHYNVPPRKSETILGNGDAILRYLENKVSISTTFYSAFFVWKYFAQLLSTYILNMEFFVKRISAHKLLVKWCWNWRQGDHRRSRNRGRKRTLSLFKCQRLVLHKWRHKD